MKYKVITTFKPGDWDKYAKRMVQSVLDKWPNVSITIYYQDTQPVLDDERISWVDIDKANSDLHKFREKYKSDPVAMGKLNEIPGGVRRSPRLKTEGGKDAFKESYLWNAVKFSYKVSCVTHAIRNSQGYDYVIWLDDDTYTFRNIPAKFLKDLCPPIFKYVCLSISKNWPNPAANKEIFVLNVIVKGNQALIAQPA